MARGKRKWGFDIEVLPGSPPSERLAPAFDLLFGDGGLIEARRLDSSKLNVADPVAHLAALYPVAQSRTNKGHQMFVYGRGDAYVSVAFSLVSGRGGSVGGLVPGADGDELVSRVSALVDMLEAVFASVFVGDREQTMLVRSSRHMEATKDEHGRAAFPFWARWGLPGLAYRSMLGRPFVESIGEDRLQAVGQDLAWPVGGHWVVAGSAEPEDWSLDPMCDQERQLIDRLGPDCFYDVETGRLPSCLPSLPPHPSFPVSIRDAATGSTKPTTAQADTPDFAAKAAWVVQTMKELVPEFGTDDQLFWVEESLQNRSAEQHDYLVDLYGAWLGEHLRTAIDGTWVETPEGWMVADETGATHDPHGRMAEYLADNSARLKPWIRSIVDAG